MGSVVNLDQEADFDCFRADERLAHRFTMVTNVPLADLLSSGTRTGRASPPWGRGPFRSVG